MEIKTKKLLLILKKSKRKTFILLILCIMHLTPLFWKGEAFAQKIDSIYGSSSVCQGQKGLVYMVNSVTNTTGYTWTYTGTGFSIASGTGTNVIIANFSDSATSGILSVHGTNACGGGTTSPLFPISVNLLPAAPVADSATNPAGNTFSANWKAAVDATTYYLDVDDTSDFSSPLASYNNKDVGNVLTITVTGLTCGTTYYYRVRAGNACGASSNSNTIAVNSSCGFPAWLYKVPITITNSGTTAFTDYQVLITMNTAALISAGKMRSDGRDIRVVDSNKCTILNFWINPLTINTATTAIWVKVPSLSPGSNTVYVYYGDSSATSASSGVNTFIIFDSIPAGSASTWTIVNDTKWNNPISTKSEVTSPYDGTTGIKQSTVGTTVMACTCTFLYKDYNLSSQNTNKTISFYYSSTRSNDTYTRPSVGIELYKGINSIGVINLAVEPARPSNCLGNVKATNNAVNTVDLSSISGSFDKLKVNLMGYACVGTNTNVIDQIILRQTVASPPTTKIGTEESSCL